MDKLSQLSQDLRAVLAEIEEVIKNDDFLNRSDTKRIDFTIYFWGHRDSYTEHPGIDIRLKASGSDATSGPEWDMVFEEFKRRLGYNQACEQLLLPAADEVSDEPASPQLDDEIPF